VKSQDQEAHTLSGIDPEVSARLAALTAELAGRQEEIEALRASVRRYKDIFEHANDLIHSLDPEGRILYVNKLWRETLGYSEQEAKALKIFDIVDQGCTARCQSIFSCMMRGEKVPPTEAVFVAKDGRRIFLEGRCTPKFEDGRAVELLGIFRDITERKQLEAEREQLVCDLKETLSRLKRLEGILPICASCKKIRDDKGCWNQIESYLHAYSSIEFSHGLCPECIQKLYPELCPDGTPPA
jgi:PAS domain S-box-containing protein